MQREYILVIPARYASTRLPGKPLVDIAGKPMIQRVYEQCAKAVRVENIYVATDDQRIQNAVQEFGGQSVLTSSDCLTGTDRVAEVARKISADFYINVQGDEPLFNPEDIQRCIDACRAFPNEVVNGYAPIDGSEDYHSRSVPKVVLRKDQRLLYMSRSPIPGNKLGDFHIAYRQICTYGFPHQALMKFAEETQKTPFENEEDIEILRFLEMGYDVRMVEMSAESIPVDHPEDVERVIHRLNA
jgi:3-deoxy-manno-octulosonate cytidylyltransferase (CMP-KDO synthetase)